MSPKKATAHNVGKTGFSEQLQRTGLVGLDQALSMIRAVQSTDAKALVRAPDKQPQWATRHS